MTFKFSPGIVVHTPSVVSIITHEDMNTLLNRHLKGDWGDIDDEDRDTNEYNLANKGRLMSSYNMPNGTVWIITERDRSSTTVLLPSDY